MKKILCMMVIVLGFVLNANTVVAHECSVTTNCSNESIVLALKDVEKELRNRHNRTAKSKLYTIRRYMDSCRHPMSRAVYDIAYYLPMSDNLQPVFLGKLETVLILMGVKK